MSYSTFNLIILKRPIPTIRNQASINVMSSHRFLAAIKKRFSLTFTSHLWSIQNMSSTSTLIAANIDPATNILLVNALYFKSLWLHKFNPRATRGGCFYNRGVCHTVAMMELHAELNYAYVDNLRAHALELPYKVCFRYKLRMCTSTCFVVPCCTFEDALSCRYQL